MNPLGTTEQAKNSIPFSIPLFINLLNKAGNFFFFLDLYYNEEVFTEEMN